MRTETITVKYINPPKGRGPASVKDATGKYWKFWTKDVPLETFRENQSYTVGFKTEPYNGQDQYYIEEVLPEQQATNGQAKIIPFHPVATAGSNGGGKDRSIYEQALLKEFIGCALVPLDEEAIVNAIQMIQRAYDRTH